MQRYDIFLTCPPGLERVLADEALATGFSNPRPVKGGVTFQGGWQHVWRANLELRCTTRVLIRIASFEAKQLSQLERHARGVDWAAVLPPACSLAVEASCRKSRIYHSGAAQERLELALQDALGCRISKTPEFTIKLRIDHDLCTISLDTSGAPLYQRGHKQAVGKAPIRETMAAAFLRLAGYDGSEPLLDPMCGSGTFVIEAAEMAAGLSAGRSRRFAFQALPSYDEGGAQPRSTEQPKGPPRCFGFDRNAGAIAASQANAARAGLSLATRFEQGALAQIAPPCPEPGLVMVNPPYGGRIGDKRQLYALYGALGQTMKQRFAGWRLAFVTNEPGLAKATGLDLLEPSAPIDHGGLTVRLYQAKPS